jgi:glycosyltransferase involved in cell wall biosynthesis
MADAIIAVSRGVAEDLAEITKLPLSRFTVIPNPVVSDKLYALAGEDTGHEWFQKKGKKIIIAAGRLTRQKDFPTLIRAFKEVRDRMDARLVILGEGGDRPKLKKLAESLSLKDDLYMPGHADNPYKYISRASIFVLSSAWEGSPNVLTEALALGVPVVATDCPSGPREILKNGVYGPIVPVGDAHALAQGIMDTLQNPHDSAFLKKAVEDYTIKNSSRLYLKAMLGLQ